MKRSLSYGSLVAAVMCSVSFIAMLAPPSAGSWARPAFMFCNTVGFSLALMLVMAGVMSVPEPGKHVLVRRWTFVGTVLCFAALALVLAFLAAAYDDASPGQWAGIAAIALAIPGGYAALLPCSPRWLTDRGLA